jgi:tripartite-type tricarboxylate transporter receptor subunit TctC
MIVGSSAGSGPDVIARIVADRLSQSWRQQITVMNKTGGFGSLALQAALSSPADGHTLVVSISSSFVIWPELEKAAAIVLEREITPIGVMGVQPMVISVNPAVGANTLPELFAITNERPDEVLFGAPRATIPHLTGARLASSGAVKWRFIPTQNQRAIQDAMGGFTHVAIESVAALASPIGAGLLKAVAVASATRLPDWPDLPTVGEQIPALKGFEAHGWAALMARSGTPENIIQKINRDLREVMSDADVQRRLSALGAYPRLLSPAATSEFISKEKELWRPIVRSLDLATR